MPTLSVAVSADLIKFVERMVEEKGYESVESVIRRGLQLLQQEIQPEEGRLGMLPPDLQGFVKRSVENGYYMSEADLIRDGVRTVRRELHDRREAHDTLVRALDRSTEEAADGGRGMTEDELDAFFNDIEDEVVAERRREELAADAAVERMKQRGL